jgi:hypothetical protein
MVTVALFSDHNYYGGVLIGTRDDNWAPIRKF